MAGYGPPPLLVYNNGDPLPRRPILDFISGAADNPDDGTTEVSPRQLGALLLPSGGMDVPSGAYRDSNFVDWADFADSLAGFGYLAPADFNSQFLEIRGDRALYCTFMITNIQMSTPGAKFRIATEDGQEQIWTEPSPVPLDDARTLAISLILTPPGFGGRFWCGQDSGSTLNVGPRLTAIHL